MNTPYSMALGWGSLLLAGGVAYFYAKRDINDRRDREHRKRLGNTTSFVKDKTEGESGGEEVPRYRLAKGSATQGRDRGDRLG